MVITTGKSFGLGDYVVSVFLLHSLDAGSPSTCCASDLEDSFQFKSFISSSTFLRRQFDERIQRLPGEVEGPIYARILPGAKHRWNGCAMNGVMAEQISGMDVQ
jgi:hypothetical protein